MSIMTTHSLPSFAQAFSAASPNSISTGNNFLPPIQSRPLSIDNRHALSPSRQNLSRQPSVENRFNSRKRPRTEVTLVARDESSGPERDSPRLLRIKQEQDQDMLDPSPPPSAEPQDTLGAPPPSSLCPFSSKKRRVTISGAPHPLNTNVQNSPDQANSTPISPVVIGINIMRDDPAAMEQVRSMLTVKQKQKELIEQRRGSVAGIVSTATMNGGNEERNAVAKPPIIPRSIRRSPNSASLVSGNRRSANPSSQGGSGTSNVRPPSPSPMIVPSQQPPVPVLSQAPMSNSLAPPPISFARRRAGLLGAKKKPADIVISPREAHTQEQFQPAIQSAPPIPQAGGQFYSGRSPMTLPRLPSVMGGGDSARRSIAGQVPPTPTQFSIQRNSTNLQPSIPGISRRSPSASIPIATTLVPPTPASLHHPGYSGDKSAFLAPFEVFYDALNDSKQLKNWLSEQLQKSNSLMQTLAQQHEKMNEVVDGLVEKKMCGMRDEMTGLHRRVEELEEALRSAKVDAVGGDAGSKSRSKQTPRNGTLCPVAPETYTFPPIPPSKKPELIRRVSSPGWRLDLENQTVPDENGSPALYDVRRVSASATRLDTPRSQQAESSAQRFAVQSPPQVFREVPGHPSMGKGGSVAPVASARSNLTLPDLGGLHRRQSHPRIASFRYQLSNPSDSGGESKVAERGSPPSRGDSRGNSTVMSPRDRANSSMDDG